MLPTHTAEVINQSGSPRSLNSFRAFLDAVVMRRLYNFARGIWRERRYVDRSRDFTELINRQEHKLPRQLGQDSALANADGDPAIIAELQEVRARLDSALDKLKEEDRWLWDRLASGQKVSVIACERAMSVSTLKRKRRALLATLQSWMTVGA